MIHEAFGTEQLPTGALANGNGSGDLIIDSANSRLYVLYTNNSVSAYSLPAASVQDWNLF